MSGDLSGDLSGDEEYVEIEKVVSFKNLLVFVCKMKVELSDFLKESNDDELEYVNGFWFIDIVIFVVVFELLLCFLCK